MQSSSPAVASAASLRSQTPTFLIRVWQPIPGADYSKVIYKFWVTIPLDGQRKANFSVASRQSFACPHCLRAINLPAEFLVKLVGTFEDGPTHYSFPCKRCGQEVNVTAEW